MSEENKILLENFIKFNPCNFKQRIISDCRQMDKLDVYEWVAEDELKIMKLQQEKQQLKDRINKAVEYMKEHESEPVDYYGTLFYELGQYEKILDLLKGDKE